MTARASLYAYGAERETLPRVPLVLATLSTATDLANDQPNGSAMRTAHIALVLAEELGLDPQARADVFYVSLMRFLGCTAYAHEASLALGGNDVALHSAFAAVEMSRPGEVMRAALTRLAPEKGMGGRARAFLGAMRGGRTLFEGFANTQCEVASRLARRLNMTPAVETALLQTYERWDGAGVPGALSGEAISLITRVVQGARLAELFCRDRQTDDEPIVKRLRDRAGGTLDPAIVEACVRRLVDVVAIVRDSSPCDALMARLPDVEHPNVTLEQIALTLADYADLKSVYRAGHSHRVAGLAVAAGEGLGLNEPELEKLRSAGLLHDLGMVSVPTGILESPRPLSIFEQERIRLHPYYTGRILALSPLATLAKIAGGHHERADASGYPAGVPRGAVSLMTRVLAAADVYRALLEPRPYRDALTPEAAERVMHEEATAERLDRGAVTAVLRAAGHAATRGDDTSLLLTGREIEVLRYVAVGNSDKEIAAKLGISPRTVHHHVARVYRKIDVSSRAAAALYAIENGLLPAD